MRAVKGNKVYTIEEGQKSHYRDAGFDIVGDDGEIISYGKGKTVPYDEYEALKTEIEALKEKLSESEETPKPERSGKGSDRKTEA